MSCKIMMEGRCDRDLLKAFYTLKHINRASPFLFRISYQRAGATYFINQTKHFKMENIIMIHS